MQLQVLKMSRTPLKFEENVKKQSIFWRFSTTPGFRACDVTHYEIFQIFLFSWTHNAPRIPKMYNIMGLWLKLEELLACKVISILHYKKKYEKIRKNTNKKLLAAEISHTDERWPDGQGIGLQNTYKLTISKKKNENREKSKFQHFQFLPPSRCCLERYCSFFLNITLHSGRTAGILLHLRRIVSKSLYKNITKN